MEQHRINMTDIVIGKPLSWDVYGEGRKLLLRKGHIIESVHQVDELIKRGLYIDAHDFDAAKRQLRDSKTQAPELPSVLRMLNAAHKRLERLLYGIQSETDVQTRIVEIADEIRQAVKLNPDIAFGCITLNQAVGNYSVRHCVDTAVLAIVIATTMNKTEEEIRIMTAAALTMNVGMLRAHDQLQAKQDGLTEKDKALILGHPQESVTILKQVGVNHAEWLAHVLMHHENEDGSGYPLGKSAGPIAQNTKILAFADRYCACVSHRKYRKTLLPSAALREVLLPGGKPRDPLLAAYFIRAIGNYPPGTFVRLQNGETAVVTRKGQTATTPIVHSLIGPRGAPLSLPLQRDTGRSQFAVVEAVLEDTTTLRFSLHQLWGDEAKL